MRRHALNGRHDHPERTRDLASLAAASCVTLVAATGHAADVYVAETAAGAASRKSCATALAIAKAPGPAPGDVLHLCGVSTTPILIGGSGTASAPITYLLEKDAKMSAPTWGGTTCSRAAARRSDCTGSTRPRM